VRSSKKFVKSFVDNLRSDDAEIEFLFNFCSYALSVIYL